MYFGSNGTPLSKSSPEDLWRCIRTKGNPINGWYPVINIQDADRKAGRATVEIYGGIFINYNPATGDNTGEADDTFVAPGYKSVETTYNGQQAWQVIPE